MFSKLSTNKKLAQIAAKNVTRGFAAASQLDGFSEMTQSPQQDMVDYQVPNLSEMGESKPKPIAKSSLPILPHFDYTPYKYSGPSYEQVKAARVESVAPASFTFYREPLLITEGKMQYLYDHTGKRYLDCIAGVSTVGLGHCHPRITEAMKAQMDKLQHITTIYMNEQHSMFAAELAEKLPEGIDQVYFTSSGSEANALATQFARLHTKNWSLMHLGNGYHGHGGSAYLTNFSPYNHDIPKTQGVELAPFPDMFRAPWSKEEAPQRYADQLKQNIDYATSGKMALFMVEAIQGAGGIVPIPKEFMQKAIPHLKETGALLLSDEVQTGFGRMGSHYWGCDMLGYKPDIVTMAKHIGNGFPLAAVATTKEIASNYKKMTFTTYGANPIAMAAGREILKVIDEEGLQEKTRINSEYMHAGFKYLEDKYEEVGDVRGHGLMLGVELVKDKESKLPNQELFGEVWERTKNYGLLMGKGGRTGCVFRFQPPMSITQEDIDFAIDVMDLSIKESLDHLKKRNS